MSGIMQQMAGHASRSMSPAASLQVWGVIIGVGNQSFAERWELVGAGTRAWEVSCLCPATLLQSMTSRPLS